MELEKKRLAVLSSLNRHGGGPYESTAPSGKPAYPVLHGRAVPGIPKPARDALLDLLRLGLSFEDIIAQSQCDEQFIASVCADLKVDVKVSTPSTPFPLSTPGAAPIAKPPSPLPVRATVLPQRASPSSEIAAVKISTPNTPLIPSPVIYSAAEVAQKPVSQVPSRSSTPGQLTPKFGSDRWSHRVHIEVSDDEDDDDPGENAAPAPAVKRTQPPGLQEKLDEIRRMSELVKQLEAKNKTLKMSVRKTLEGESSATPGSGSSSLESPETSDIPPAIDTPRSKSPLPEQQMEAPGSPTSSSMEEELAAILRRQELVAQRRDALRAEIARLPIEQVKASVEKAKAELDTKLHRLSQISSQVETVSKSLAEANREQAEVAMSLQLIQQRLKRTATTPPVMESKRARVGQDADIKGSRLTHSAVSDVLPRFFLSSSSRGEPNSSPGPADTTKESENNTSVAMDVDDNVDENARILASNSSMVASPRLPETESEEEAIVTSLSEIEDMVPQEDHEGVIAEGASGSMEQDRITNETTLPAIPGIEWDITEKYRPYRSPLIAFESFRFSPTFLDHVGPSGYKSLTYSADKGQVQPFCDVEFLGRDCVNTGCKFTHLGDFKVDDHTVLSRLGHAPVGNAKVFKEGLVGFLKSPLRAKHFDGLAKEIIEYRQARMPRLRFLDWHRLDASKAGSETIQGTQ